MFAEEIRRALQGTPRVRLAELAAAVWKGFACGALEEGEAQQLAEEIAARKIVPPTPAEPRRRVGSRPRSPEHMERRRRWTGSGWLPPQIVARFTMAETAVLSVIAAEVARRGLCRLTIGHIAVLAGVSRTTVQSTVRQAVALGILTSEEWRFTAWRSAPNTVRIVSPEWRAWLKMRDRRRAGSQDRLRAGFKVLNGNVECGPKIVPGRTGCPSRGVGSNSRTPYGLQIHSLSTGSVDETSRQRSGDQMVLRAGGRDD